MNKAGEFDLALRQLMKRHGFEGWLVFHEVTASGSGMLYTEGLHPTEHVAVEFSVKMMLEILDHLTGKPEGMIVRGRERFY